jgi:hypothetical protein
MEMGVNDTEMNECLNYHPAVLNQHHVNQYWSTDFVLKIKQPLRSSPFSEEKYII